MKQYLDPVAVSRLASMEIRAKLVVEGFFSGTHRSPLKGRSTDFADYRKYTKGDDLRRIEWKVFAKADRYYIKEYEEQTTLSAWILLDTSESMGYRSAPGPSVSKLAYSCYVAGALAYLMMKQQDNAGLVTFSDRLHLTIPPRRSSSHLHVLLDELEKLAPAGHTRCAAALDQVGARLKKRGLLIVLSDLLDDQAAVLASLKVLRGMKTEVIVFHLLDRDELELPFSQLMEFEDLETGERLKVDCETIRRAYRERVARFTGFFADECPRAGIDYVTVNTSETFHEVLVRYLLKRGEERR